MPKKEKDPKRVSAGKKSKRKGRSFEQLIVKKLKDAGFAEAKRGWWQSGEFARYAGQKQKGAKPRVPDVMLDGFWLELGSGESMDTYKKLDQALLDCPPAEDWKTSTIPVSIVRKKGQRIIYCTMLLVDFERLLARIRDVTPYAYRGRDDLQFQIRVSMRFEDFIELVKALRGIEEVKEEPPYDPNNDSFTEV